MTTRFNFKAHQEEFIRLYVEEGQSLSKIAVQYQTTGKTIRKWLVAAGVEIRPKSLVTEEMKEEFKRRYQLGETVQEISKSSGIAWSSIRTVLVRDYGFEVGDPTRRKFAHLMDEFKTCYESGMSSVEIANRFDVSEQTVLNYLNELKIPIRTYEEASRKYRLNEYYFDTLNEKKSYQLGLIYALSYSLDPTDRQVVLGVQEGEEELLAETIEDLSNQAESGFVRITQSHKIPSIRSYLISTYLKQRLIELGLQSHFPKEATPYEEAFWEGFFKGALTISSQNLRISTSIHGDDFIQSALNFLASKGIPTEDVVMDCRSITFIQQKNLVWFATTYPFVTERIKQQLKKDIYIKTRQHWESVLEKIGQTS